MTNSALLQIFPLVQTHLKVLKSKDVQDADGFEVFFALDAVVELADDPVETLRIKCHGHGVSGVHRLPRSRENVTEYDSNNIKFKIRIGKKLVCFQKSIQSLYISGKCQSQKMTCK